MTQPSQWPSPTSPGFGPPAPLAPRRVSRAAVASLVFGILGCVPEITGLLAIVFGVIGWRRGRDPRVGGRGLAAAGLALGILSVVLWSAGLAIGAIAWFSSDPARTVAKQYITDFSRRDIDAVMRASTNSVTESQVQALSHRLQPLGALRDVSFSGFHFTYIGMGPQWTLNGHLSYANGEAVFNITVIQGPGGWKVNSFWVNPRITNPRPTPENIEVNRMGPWLAYLPSFQ